MRRSKIRFEQVPVADVIKKLAEGTATVAPRFAESVKGTASISGTTVRPQGNLKRKAKKP
jgi:hypothetical protein